MCKNIGIRTCFGWVMAESVRFLHHLAFCMKVPRLDVPIGFTIDHPISLPRLATCFIARKDCIFWGASFEPIENLATFGTQKLQGFHGTPLYYCYTPLTITTTRVELAVISVQWQPVIRFSVRIEGAGTGINLFAHCLLSKQEQERETHRLR